MAGWTCRDRNLQVWDGDLKANHFIGDGSLLTGITPGTTDHAALSHLDYATSGHTGFQPAGSYLTAETDPIYSANTYAVGMNQNVKTTSSPTFDIITAGQVKGGTLATLHYTLPSTDGAANYVLTSHNNGSPTWAVVASGCSFGTTTQIPYMNAGGTDFLYSDNFTFDGTNLKLLDSKPLVLGTGGDTSFLYDGNTAIFTPDVVGTGAFIVLKGGFDASPITSSTTSANYGIAAGQKRAGNNQSTGGWFAGQQTGSASTTTTYGLNAFAYFSGTGSNSRTSLPGANGGLYEVRNIGTGTITWAANIAARGQQTAAGTLTLLDSIAVLAPSITAGTVTTYNGVHIYDSSTASTNRGVYIESDNLGLDLGAAADAKINYNGTDLLINPRVVGTGNMKLSAGSVNSFVGYQVQGTAGLGTTATPLVITTAALTALGSQGSMTFIGGILTAQTQAT